MPGVGAHRFQWIGKPPLYWTIIFCALMVHVPVSLVLFFTLSHWAQTVPDTSHPIELRVRGVHSYYLSHWLGWYMNNDIWITFALLGILALIIMIHHDKIEWIS